jgi:hypothetical protein
MEVAILFLLKAIGSGVVGHYLKKGLETIDPHLVTMMNRGSSPKEIGEYVTAHELTHDVEHLATTVVQDSVVLPVVSEQAPTLETRADFFAKIIEAGFLLSSIWKADLLLKGSFFGPHGFMLFISGEQNLPEVRREGVSVNIKAPLGLGLKIAPLKDEQIAAEIWTVFKDLLLHAKGDQNTYIHLNSLKDDLSFVTDRCKVERITATSVKFSLASLIEDRKDLGVAIDAAGKAAITDWEKGIDCFIQSVSELRDAFVLPVDERAAIQSLSSRLSGLLDLKA